MSSENIEEILKKLGSQDVPPDVREIAKETSKNFARKLIQSKRSILWGQITSSRITKLAVAAVIIIGACLFLTRYGTDKQIKKQHIAKTITSPAELTTFASLSFAYRQGGMERFEEICDKALKLAGQRPANVSMREFVEEINNGS